MEIIKGAENFPEKYKKKVHLALGNFDGVHLGHQEVILNSVKSADKNGGIGAALIFQPHPAKVINPDSNLMLLSDISMKSEKMASLGLDCLIIEPFDLSVASLTPEVFFKNYLLEKIGVKSLSTGFDYSFGRNAGGTTAQLKRWGEKYDFQITVTPPVTFNTTLISSSLIRKMIFEGNVKDASLFLNYYFYRKGKVVTGDGRGKILGLPTANLDIAKELILPGNGVYFTAVSLEGSLMFAATNIGVRPTFSTNRKTVEVNILDYEGNLYGKTLTVYFLEKVRDEVAFNEPAPLISQLKEDISYCRVLSKAYTGKFTSGFIDESHI